MREKHEVLDRFRELRDRYLRERMAQFLSRMPINCQYNVSLRVKGKGHLGFCQNPLILAKLGSHGMFSCNEIDTACRCRLFTCKNTESSVKESFDEIIGSPARCGNDYPKLAMLIWFLQEFSPRSRIERLGALIQRGVKSLSDIILLRWW